MYSLCCTCICSLVDLSLRIPLMFLCCDMLVSSDSTVSYKQPFYHDGQFPMKREKIAPCLTCQAGLSAVTRHVNGYLMQDTSFIASDELIFRVLMMSYNCHLTSQTQTDPARIAFSITHGDPRWARSYETSTTS